MGAPVPIGTDPIAGCVMAAVDLAGWWTRWSLRMSPVVPASVGVALIAWRYRPRPAARRPGSSSPRRSDGSNSDGSRTPPPEPHNAKRPRRRTSWGRSARRSIIDGDVAARWCDAIARHLRSGSSLSVAVVDADRPPEVDREIGSTLDRIGTDGVGLAEQMDRLGRERAGTDLGLLTAVLASVARLGGAAAEPIDRTAAVLRGRAAAEADRIAHSAQARMSARVMTLLPIAMLALLVATSASVRATMRSPAGIAVVIIGATLNLIGWLWIDRIIGRGPR